MNNNSPSESIDSVKKGAKLHIGNLPIDIRED